MRQLPRENPLVFYPRRVWEVVETHAKLAAFYLFLHRIRRRVERDATPYVDAALTQNGSEQLIPSVARRKEKTVRRVAA